MSAARKLALLVAAVVVASPAARGAALVGCDQADKRVTLGASADLDPSCTWTRGIQIVASDVVLDCQGAHVATADRRIGIEITAPTDVALSNVTVRNCHVEGFLNNVRITRDGFRDLLVGQEYDHAFSNIVIENVTSLNSRGVGMYVDGYVTGVTIRNSHIEGAGSAGIYLEHGSKDNVVEHDEIVNNGYKENGPDGQFFEGSPVWFWGTGREGLAIDGSRFNRVTDNFFTGNSAGAIFLYKNCGEFVHLHPDRYFVRRYGADGNLIADNTIVGEDNGVWIASRMGENTAPMDCSDPQYAPGYSLDYAADAVVRGNVFQDVTFGVRVEDDRAVVADNRFTGGDPRQDAIVIGTRYRTSVLGRPVDGTTITGNDATIAGNTNPYRWIHGHMSTTFADNRSHGRIAGLCEGEQPPTGPFVFVVAFELADPQNPPSGPPMTLPPPNVLPPCPLACAAGTAVGEPTITIGRLGTPPGDDRLTFRGDVTPPRPFTPALDPVAVGVGIQVSEANGGRVIDVRVPGGAYDRVTKAGWIASPAHGSWKYANRSAAPPAGITGVTIKDLAAKHRDAVHVTVVGKRGAYAVDPAALPLTGLLVLDPPTAETGQCGIASFAGPPPSCRSDGRTVRCR